MAEAREQFLQTVFQRVIDIEAVLASIEQQGPNANALQFIRQQAHKTAGVAGTFGLKEVGDHAADVDRSIGLLMSSRRADTNWRDVRSKIDAMLDAMECALD